MTVYAVVDGVGRLYALYKDQAEAWKYVVDSDIPADLNVEPWEVRGA